MTPAQAAARVAVVLLAASTITPFVAEHEGWVKKTYPDPAHGKALISACAGATRGLDGKPFPPDKVIPDEDCMALLARDLVQHGMDIDRCIKVEVPVPSRAAFTSFAYNVGTPSFCGSTLVRKLNAGDLAGACAELSRWVSAGGRQMLGLVRRRAAERAYCERGLRP